MRLMMLCSFIRRKSRGLGFPGCAEGVTVPVSMKPKPSAPKASTASPFLSSPAASPRRLGNLRPMTSTGSWGTEFRNALPKPSACAADIIDMVR